MIAKKELQTKEAPNLGLFLYNSSIPIILQKTKGKSMIIKRIINLSNSIKYENWFLIRPSVNKSLK